MQKMFIKKGFGKAFFVCIGLALLSSPVFAQPEQQRLKALVNDARGLTNAANLCYRYKISIIDTKSQKEQEQLQGAYYKKGKSFLDSNKYSVSLLADGYYFKTEQSEKKAYLYKLSTIEEKAGIRQEDFNGITVAVPDSMALKLGVYSSKDVDDNIEICYSLKQRDAQINTIYFLLRKKDHQLLEIRLVSPLSSGKAKVCRLFAFANDFDNKKINGSKFYSVSGSKAVLTSAYRSYNLEAIL